MALSYYMQKRFVGDVVSLTVLRNKELLDLKVSLSCTQDLVPKHIKDRTPPYIVVAGLVFTILSMPFLDCEIEPDLSWQTAELTHLMELASYGERASEKQKVVVLAHVLAHGIGKLVIFEGKAPKFSSRGLRPRTPGPSPGQAQGEGGQVLNVGRFLMWAVG